MSISTPLQLSQTQTNICSCLVVEDQEIFSRLLCSLLKYYINVELIATASSVSEAFTACEKLKPDLLILDLNLPDGNGIEVAQAFSCFSPDGKIIILSGYASSFIAPSELLDYIFGVVDKTAAFKNLQILLEKLFVNPLSSLTPRQRQIFTLIGNGFQNKEIASHLQLSITTVETHRKAIAMHLNKSGAELLVYAATFNRLYV